MRTWAKRAGLAAGVLTLAAGGYAAANRTALEARYAAYQLQRAATDDDRTACVARLAALGGDGFARIADGFRDSNDAVGEATRAYLAARPVDDATVAPLTTAIFAEFDAYPAAGQVAALGLVPDAVRCGACEPGCTAVAAGLKSPHAAARARAARLAVRPELKLAAEAAALRTDPDAAVRAAAFLVIGAPGNESLVPDEDVFRALHDPAADVRSVATAVLTAQGRSALDIAKARRLTHPDAGERLQLLVDLAEEPGRDAGPWLERLARDAVPAVRAGAARVAAELRLPFAGWLDALAADDPDPTVRQVARYYRSRADGLTAVGGTMR